MAGTQVIQQPILYTNNLKLAWASITTLTVTSVNSLGKKRDKTNVTDIALPSTITINAALNGINALDTGSLAASTWYTVWAIGDSYLNNASGYLLSTSATAPTLPSGYDVYAIVGYWVTNSSSEFVKGSVAGTGSVRDHIHDDMIKVLNDGTATSLTAVDLSAAVPPIDNTPVDFDVEFKGASAGDRVGIAAGGSTATVLPSLGVSSSSGAARGYVKQFANIVSSVAKVSYINSAASGNTDLWVSGFRYYI